MPSSKLSAILFALLSLSAQALPVHGLWVWKSASVLDPARGAETLRDFCQSERIDEVYVAASGASAAPEDRLAGLIALLHRSHIRVEALLSSDNADEPGKHREKLLEHVRTVVRFNRSHRDRFDGIHLDIEPQQRPENKGPGNLGFLPGLASAYHDVRALAEPAQLTVNADIQNKLLKGSLAERTMLLTALPRLTLMLYELTGKDEAELRAASQKFLDMAYDGLDGPNLAQMVIALRTPDYGERLPAMLQVLDDAYRANPHYAGCARHSYNDVLAAR